MTATETRLSTEAARYCREAAPAQNERRLSVGQLETLDTIRELAKANGAAWLGAHGSRAYSLEKHGLVRREQGTKLRWNLTSKGHHVAATVMALRGLRRFFRRN